MLSQPSKEGRRGTADSWMVSKHTEDILYFRENEEHHAPYFTGHSTHSNKEVGEIIPNLHTWKTKFREVG